MGERTDPSSAVSHVSTGQLMDSSAEMSLWPYYTPHHYGCILSLNTLQVAVSHTPDVRDNK